MATKNLGNVVGLIKSPTPPAKTFVLWAKQLNPALNPDLVELHYYNGTAWVPLTGGGSEGGYNPMISLAYNELRDLRDASSLIPGQQYRITDYITTVREDLDWAISAQHQFDVIVIADSVNTLNEKARAARTEEDSYFPEYTRFEAWELMYSIDNNVNLYDWADPENGKGVIYYMKDEFNNELPYDFKSIKFKRCRIEDSYFGALVNTYRGLPSNIGNISGIKIQEDDYMYFYTFHNMAADTEVSVSLTNTYRRNFYGNIIKPNIYRIEVDDLLYNTYVLNNNVFLGETSRICNNIMGQDVQKNTFAHYVFNNIIKGNMSFCVINSLNDCSFGFDVNSIVVVNSELPSERLGFKTGDYVRNIYIQGDIQYFIEIKDLIYGGAGYLDVADVISANFNFSPATVTIFRAQDSIVFEAYKDANNVERFNV